MACHASPAPKVRPNSALIDARAVANYTGFSILTLEAWRKRGRGPAYVRVGGRAIRYRPADVDAWLERQTRVDPAAADKTAQGEE